MAVKELSSHPKLALFLSFGEAEIKYMSPTDALTLHDIIEPLSDQFTGNKQAFASLRSAIHNSMVFFQTSFAAFEQMTAIGEKLQKNPWRKKMFTLHQNGKMRQDFEKFRTHSRIKKEYDEAYQTVLSQRDLAHQFLIQAQMHLRACC